MTNPGEVLPADGEDVEALAGDAHTADENQYDIGDTDGYRLYDFGVGVDGDALVRRFGVMTAEERLAAALDAKRIIIIGSVDQALAPGDKPLFRDKDRINILPLTRNELTEPLEDKIILNEMKYPPETLLENEIINEEPIRYHSGETIENRWPSTWSDSAGTGLTNHSIYLGLRVVRSRPEGTEYRIAGLLDEEPLLLSEETAVDPDADLTRYFAELGDRKDNLKKYDFDGEGRRGVLPLIDYLRGAVDDPDRLDLSTPDE